jgi:hypothetical protein
MALKPPPTFGVILLGLGAPGQEVSGYSVTILLRLFLLAAPAAPENLLGVILGSSFSFRFIKLRQINSLPC